MLQNFTALLQFQSVTHFSSCLSTAISGTSVSLREVARRVGVDNSQLSRLCSGARPPSAVELKSVCEKLNPHVFEHLAQDYGDELAVAWLRDCAKLTGRDDGMLRISFSAGEDDGWWQTLPPSLMARLKALAVAGANDAEFGALLESLEPLALKLQAAVHDARELERLKRGEIVAFPEQTDRTEHVAEDAPPPLPRGRSQEPTA